MKLTFIKYFKKHNGDEAFPRTSNQHKWFNSKQSIQNRAYAEDY